MWKAGIPVERTSSTLSIAVGSSTPGWAWPMEVSKIHTWQEQGCW